MEKKTFSFRLFLHNFLENRRHSILEKVWLVVILIFALLATAKHKNDYIIVVMTLSVPKVKEVRSIKKFEKNLFYFSTSIKDDVSP